MVGIKVWAVADIILDPHVMYSLVGKSDIKQSQKQNCGYVKCFREELHNAVEVHIRNVIL